jgi:hypothetical protein
VPDDPSAPVPPSRAVIDRIVDETAVLLVGDSESERHVPVSALPEGAGDGTWLVVDPDSEPVTIHQIDVELTSFRAQDLERRLQQIRRRRTGGRFER